MTEIHVIVRINSDFFPHISVFICMGGWEEEMAYSDLPNPGSNLVDEVTGFNIFDNPNDGYGNRAYGPYSVTNEYEVRAK